MRGTNTRVITIELEECNGECPFNEGTYISVCIHPEIAGTTIRGLMVDDPFPEFCPLKRKEADTP